jgi:hypothetical protein
MEETQEKREKIQKFFSKDLRERGLCKDVGLDKGRGLAGEGRGR